ncbi:PH domain-containing protein [Subtercola sp. YIM 133946]|uniref:PH domain-containing protein n=1 Tax=Subtercola sp. YIM 133946 TaxID=3118909 RepID=UPI002F952713
MSESSDSGPLSAGLAGLAGPDDDWQRVSPKYVAVEFAASVLAGLIMSAISVFFIVVAGWWLGWWMLGASLIVTIVLLVVAPRRARAIGYRLRDDDLLMRRGIMFFRIVAVPYGRMQLIDVNRGPLGRALGLSDLKFVTAAATTAVSIPGLPEEEADALRDQLVALAETRRTGL